MNQENNYYLTYTFHSLMVIIKIQFLILYLN